MIWEVCLVLAIVLFVGIIVVGVIVWRNSKREKRLFSLLSVILLATFVSSLFLVFPYCLDKVGTGEGFSKIGAVSMTFRTSLQVFSLDADYAELFEGIVSADLGSGMEMWYQICSAVIYIVAPILLVGVIITIFQRVLDRMKLHISGDKNIYIFSKLNAQSLILARSCMAHEEDVGGKRPIILFTDVYEQSGEESSELTASARGIGAVCQRNDILNIRTDLKKKRGNVWLFIIGPDETENTGQALSLIDRYEDCSHISLYVLSDSVETELMFESAMSEDTKMKIRRINSEQSLVYSYLYDTEHNCLFDYTCQLPDGKKVLSVVLVGLGRRGTQFLRALVWYGQMPGIRLQIHVFEKDPMAEEKFTSLCPELMKMNHNEIEGESQYDIWFHHSGTGAGIDAETADFDQEILSLQAVSIAFAVLGDDARNIRTAVKMRRLFTQNKLHPVIQAVVFNPERNEQKNRHDFEDFKGDQYDIGFIGNIQTTWSYDYIMQPELERVAKERNLRWIDTSANDYEEQLRLQTKQFYQYEYYRKSSMSSAIRSKVRQAVHVPGAEKLPEKRTDEEKYIIESIEHAGWNAYMRSEGYQYASERNDLAKFHNLLVPFGMLHDKEKDKDNA